MADAIQNENFIQLKKDNILRFGIRDAEGNEIKDKNGKNVCLEFDMEDVSLCLKMNQCEEEHRKNIKYVRDQFIIIDKKEDKKGKKLLSWKKEEEIRVLNEFYRREMNALDLFLGKGGCKKLLNGRNPYYTMYDDFAEIIEPILPKLQIRADDIKKKIINKYGKNEERNVLK